MTKFRHIFPDHDPTGSLSHHRRHPGFLGINVARHLLARGHRVVSLDIAPFTADYPERDRITEVTGDIRDKATVDRAMDGVDIVVHTAAALPLYAAEDIYTTDHRRQPQHPAIGPRAQRPARDPHLLHRGLWHSRPPSPLRGRPTSRRRPLR
ncbi:MAG: NAD-dependent epimerase/dehydratase family protein [Caldilineaceae bacterium]